MKKIVVALALCIIVLLMGTFAGCEFMCAFDEGGFHYYCENDAVYVNGFCEGNFVADLHFTSTFERSENFFLGGIDHHAFENTVVETLTVENTAHDTVHSTPILFYTVLEAAFKNCKLLREVNLPYSTKWIDDEAFYGCESLTKITLPYCVESLYQYAFANCTNLKEVHIDEKMEHIYTGVFDNCADGLTVWLKCPPPKLASGRQDGEELAREIFNGTENFVLKIPQQYIEAYKSDADWAKYVDHMVVVEA